MGYTQDELAQASSAIESTICKCEKSLTKLREGSPQHTLTVRQIKAFKIAVELIKREMGDCENG